MGIPDDRMTDEQRQRLREWRQIEKERERHTALPFHLPYILPGYHDLSPGARDVIASIQDEAIRAEARWTELVVGTQQIDQRIADAQRRYEQRLKDRARSRKAAKDRGVWSSIGIVIVFAIGFVAIYVAVDFLCDFVT
jgi:hypothetical protein